MRLSFKYKFILSFVTVEIIFISLIVFFNFSSLNSLSKSLVDEKIETATKLFTKLVTAPMAVYDLAMLDNTVESFINIKNIVAVEIFDKQHRLISHSHDTSPIYKEIYKNTFHNEPKQVEVNGRTFRLSILPIKVGTDILGDAEIIFEITDSLKTIESNRDLTFILVLFEIMFSMLMAYVIGYRLTRALSILTTSAQKIAQNDQIVIPDIKSNGDEISILADALHIMQQRIAQRNKTLNDLVRQLKKERDFHSALLDQASSIVLVMNKKGEIVLTNKTVEKITGYTQSELQGKIAWKTFIPKEIQDSVEKVFVTLTAGDFPSSYENVWIAKDGSHVPFAWSNSCITDDNGDIEYVIAVGIDMTEKNKTQQTIQTLLNSPVVSIILMDVDETILEINEIAAKRLNSKVDELKGKKISICIPENLASLRRRYLDELILIKKPVSFEEKRNGSIFKVHFYPIFGNNGNVTQISIFSHDITEVKKAQKELDKYIKLVDDNVMTSHADLQGIITSVSQAFCKMTGYSDEELIGQKYNIIRHPDMPASTYESLWNTIQKGKMWRGEIKNQTKDGHPYWVETSVYPDFNDKGDIVGYNAIRQDITDKKRIEEISITDSLTRLYNRRYFDDIFDREIKRIKRDKKVFCLLSLDVDNFKTYNDRYGHQRGDNVLVTVGHVLKEYMKRAGDFAFRIGGEEFSAIYSVEDAKSIYYFADKIRSSIENEKIEHKENTASAYVTVSIGVIFIDFSKNRNAATDQSTLYNAADELLYRAKNEGRNRVIVQEMKE